MKPIDFFKMGMQILAIVISATVGFTRLETKIEYIQKDVSIMQAQQAKMADKLSQVSERVF